MSTARIVEVPAATLFEAIRAGDAAKAAVLLDAHTGLVFVRTPEGASAILYLALEKGHAALAGLLRATA